MKHPPAPQMDAFKHIHYKASFSRPAYTFEE